ncbi:MAG: translesion DNA synthesis-associated protein ImuA [Polaromonas sp.]|nr:translesion DNA synthesis-associated protein ImuA [Polaromonas sp.]
MHSSTFPVHTSYDLASVLAKTAVWRAGELGGASLQAVGTGYTALDHVLPGGGWPQGALTEVLQPQAGVHEWGLVLPALAAAQAASPLQMTVLVNTPFLPFGPALAARQFNMQRLLCINSGQGRGGQTDAPSLLWATREALQCADVGAVLAWLPDARSAHLRRLQIAAHAHNKLLFVFRPLRAQNESSPAPLRLLLQGALGDAGNLLVDVFKRRGPPLAAPVLLDTRPARLSALLLASRERRRRRDEAVPAPVSAPQVIDLSDLLRRPLHALDRIASLDSH